MDNGNISNGIAPEPQFIKWLYEPKYTDLMPQRLLELLENDEARSISQCCVKLKITRRTFYKWLKEHEQFKLAWEYGKECMQLHYEEDAKAISNGDKGRNASAAMHKYLMSSVLEDYRERKEIHVIDNFKDMTPEQLVIEARRRLQALPNEKLSALGFDRHQLEQLVEGTQL